MHDEIEKIIAFKKEKLLKQQKQFVNPKPVQKKCNKKPKIQTTHKIQLNHPTKI